MLLALLTGNAHGTTLHMCRFIVKPTKAKGFIEAFEKSKDGAEKYEGYEANHAFYMSLLFQ